jgi:hypothetical protein
MRSSYDLPLLPERAMWFNMSGRCCGRHRSGRAEIAQLVEHATENRGVASSILALGTTHPVGAWQRLTGGSGSVGRASPCQGEGRGFESRLPLHFFHPQAPARTAGPSSSGRTADFGSVNRGSNPRGPANLQRRRPAGKRRGDVPKWLRGRSAKPLFTGSNPVVASTSPRSPSPYLSCVFAALVTATARTSDSVQPRASHRLFDEFDRLISARRVERGGPRR